MNTKQEKILKMSKFLDTLMKIGAVFSILSILANLTGAIIAPSIDLTRFTVQEMLGNTRFDGSIEEFRTIMLTGILSAAVTSVIFLLQVSLSRI